MKIGYARVSTKEQNLDLQLQALEAAGCDIIFEEQMSGAKSSRPELARALHLLKPADTLIVYKLDRLTRSLQHLLEINQILQARGANLQSTTNEINTTTAMGKCYFQIIGAIAEMERGLILERTIAGLTAARRSGKKLGRKRKVDPKSVDALIRTGLSPVEVGRQLKISRATVYRAMGGMGTLEDAGPKSP